MAHSHSHAHSHGDDQTAWFLDQLFSVVACLALAGVTITLYYTKLLNLWLAPKFHIWVLLGGLGLLALALIRAAVIWRQADELAETPAAPHGHGHEHSHGHDHDHGHAHGHDPASTAVTTPPA